MGTHTNDDSVFREFQRSLKQKQPDFLFAHFMLERNKKALDSTDKGGWTTFMHACKKGNMEVLKWLHHRRGQYLLGFVFVASPCLSYVFTCFMNVLIVGSQPQRWASACGSGRPKAAGRR